ncbi:MAG: ABC transporter substrate-binding protein [Candidatus Lambdaproteobacteria bacterium]|nr:ABC transporter substrate-binding protein [Candidatus Lambdaproteobacteria bacterium]
MNWHRILNGLLGALVALGLTSVGAMDVLAQKRGGTLVMVVPDEPPSFDGHRETTFALIHPIAPHYSVLVRVDPQEPASGDIVGDVAQSWTVSGDKKTYTFKLRRDVKFWDGTPLTARDVVATYRKIIFPPEGVLSARQAYYLMVDAVENPDEYTVVFKLKFASPAFMPALAVPFNFLYSADKLAQDIHWYEKNVLGSGPFKFKSRSPGANWVGERNESYYRAGQPSLDGYEAIFASKESVRVQAIRGERAHIEFRGFSPAARDDLVRALGDKITVQESTWNCGLYVVPNPHKKPFDDARVRRALSLAMDRRGGSQFLSRIAIVKTVGGIVFPGHALAPTEAELEQLEGFGKDIAANRAKARKLLAEAGVPQGFKFKLHNRDVDQPYKIVGTWLVDQWRQIGLDVEQWVQPTGPFFKVLRSPAPQEFDVSIDFNCQTLINPTLDVSLFISADIGKSNNGKYIDRVLDDLYERQMRESDPARQKALLMQMQQRLIDQGHYIPTLWWHRIIPHSSKVKGWKITPSHYLNQDLGNVWLEE